MAMTAKLWSVNGLATELEIDRRTLAKKLSGIEPDGELRGSPAWKMRTAVDAVMGKSQGSEPDQMEVEKLQILRAKRRSLELSNERREGMQAEYDWQDAAIQAMGTYYHLRLRPIADWLFEELRARGVKEERVIAGTVLNWFIGCHAEAVEKLKAAAAEARKRGIVIRGFGDLERLLPPGFGFAAAGADNADE